MKCTYTPGRKITVSKGSLWVRGLKVKAGINVYPQIPVQFIIQRTSCIKWHVLNRFWNHCCDSNSSWIPPVMCGMEGETVSLQKLQQCATATAKLLQSCLTLCDPIDGSPPGSPVPGIFQARTLELVAISFSNSWKWEVKVKLLSRVPLWATPWTAAYQGSSIHGIFQARALEWGAIAFSNSVNSLK